MFSVYLVKRWKCGFLLIFEQEGVLQGRPIEPGSLCGIGYFEFRS